MKNANKCSVKEEDRENLLLQYEVAQVEAIDEAKEKYRKIVNAGISRWVKDFQSGHIKIDSVDDLKKLIELDLELQRDDF
ncbi:hypothetical protein [Bacillus sp. JCM 19034]|uniref:hypothetical protein n=1 Tax=Bacillus sp. JCM 19034 TaxID=1481928 RepID=UPI00078459E8|nr:hypothetical protein [Bacillus sp. JCM 19034]